MELNKLKVGAEISFDIRIDSPLDSQNGIDTYLASDKQIGHVLVHLIPDTGNQALNQLQKAVDFYHDVLELECRCGRVNEGLYFAEPFPLGEFMFEWLEKRERVSLPEAIKRVIAQLKILQMASDEGIHHGRLTPKSILLERSFEDFDLRMMGLGVAQAMEADKRLDIDWLDYTFDLEGMSPQAVDIYGMAIVLMGLVSGESGIDSFESTGLLPPILRGGLLQQAMERALALRVDSYSDILSFSQDLEASLLELDGKQGELFIGDLVGFESAVKSISSITEAVGSLRESSGSWSAIVDNIEQDERSNLLRSLTSLTAVKPVSDDEDEDITRVSSVPDFVLHSRRIRSTRGQDSDESKATQPELKTDENDIVELAGEKGQNREKTARLDMESGVDLDEEASQKLADLQSMEAELDFGEDIDDSPTRVMKRPNYVPINLASEEEPTHQELMSEEDKLNAVITRIKKADVVQHVHLVGHDVYYDPNDPVAFPEGPCAEEEKKNSKVIVVNTNSKHHHSTKRLSKDGKLSDKIYIILLVLGLIIITLLVVVILRLI